ncbi:MAG: SWIM zinc finger family protein, partial [Pirellulales bacterium]
FPGDSEIHLDCDCPDWAGLCKHLAAVLYGVGARLDEQPELLFLLRGVKHDELIDCRLDEAVASSTGRGGRRRTVNSDDLGDVFGIDLEETPMVENGSVQARSASSLKKTPKKKAKAQVTPKSRKKETASTMKEKVAKKKTATKKKGPAKRKSVKKKKTVAKKKPAAPKKTK